MPGRHEADKEAAMIGKNIRIYRFAHKPTLDKSYLRVNDCLLMKGIPALSLASRPNSAYHAVVARNIFAQFNRGEAHLL